MNKIDKCINKFVKDITKLSEYGDALDGDETQFIADTVRVELDWNNGNLTNEEYAQQTAHLEKHGYV